MSRSNYDKPFYVDVGTSIVAVRCASNHDVVLEYDHSRHPFVIELAEKTCDRMRFGRYCDKFTNDGMHCESCPCCGKIPFGRCEFVWGQMLYKEGGAK